MQYSVPISRLGTAARAMNGRSDTNYSHIADYQ